MYVNAPPILLHHQQYNLSSKINNKKKIKHFSKQVQIQIAKFVEQNGSRECNAPCKTMKERTLNCVKRKKKNGTRRLLD